MAAGGRAGAETPKLKLYRRSTKRQSRSNINSASAAMRSGAPSARGGFAKDRLTSLLPFIAKTKGSQGGRIAKPTGRSGSPPWSCASPPRAERSAVRREKCSSAQCKAATFEHMPQVVAASPSLNSVRRSSHFSSIESDPLMTISASKNAFQRRWKASRRTRRRSHSSNASRVAASPRQRHACSPECSTSCPE